MVSGINNSGLEAGLDEADAARRDALNRLGVMGNYVAPAMMVLLSSKASAQTISSGSTG